ncbi:Signal transduction histidine kinase [Verrucomicrobium sp. GAS474]|uniref:sensor histidine kinase n=1 Tax=Verrucomicrobium sp. GAS474 TaxID=1882831 RepID=UPI000879DA40|nr:ATP-binding protein [Verrucomicrobium sp. GAS474]SDU13202.1 Signal transduction histidine kinase [Verrucomicrobium sp. GAS474]
MLRTRLFLGFLSLLLLLLAIGLYSIERCSSLGQRVQLILQDNDRSVRAVQQLKVNCTKMTSSLLAAQPAKGPAPSAPSRPDPRASDSRVEFSEACRLFEAALEEEEKISRTGPEQALTHKLREIHTAYLRDAWQLLDKSASAAAANPGATKPLAFRVATQTTAMLELSDQILDASRAAINARNIESGKDITSTIRLMILAMIIAIVVAIYTCIWMSRSVLRPIDSLSESIRQIGEGDLDQILPSHSRNELGRLAARFNTMVAQLRGYRNANSEKLQRLNLTMERTLAAFPDPIFVLNAAGAVEFRNPAGDSLALKLLFSGVRRLPEQVEKMVEKSLAWGEDYLPSHFKDSVMLRFDNSEHYFMPRIVLLRDENKSPFGAAVIMEDITRMRLVDEIKDNLVTTVSHELKTPLTSVRMALYLLLEKMVGPLNDQQEELLATAREDSDRLLNMINDLLDLARLEQGPPELNLELIPPARLFENARRETLGLASEAGISLTLEEEKDLPQVRVDTERMAFVVNNLVSNAIKYSPHGETIHLKITRQEGNLVRLSVRDHGPGIAPEHHSRIFEKFYRVAGSRKRGAGLGLAIAREIVRAHDGEVGVHSRPGEGSEFYIILPAAPAAPAHAHVG